MTTTSKIEQLKAELTAFIALAKSSNLQELEIGEGDRRFRVRFKDDAKPASAKPTTDVIETSSTNKQQVAQTAGTYLPAHPEQSTPAIQSGDSIQKGDTLAIIKIGPLFVPVIAQMDGIVSTVCCQSGQAVEYGTVLFEIEPKGTSL